jgi:hypothetical protein
MRKKVLIIFIIIIFGFISYWIFSIVKCEILTSKYGAEFVGLELQTNMLNSAKETKVLFYSEKKAIIYYKDEFGGDILEFIKDDKNEWVLNKWVITVWSKSGSADGFMWPYIR